MPWLVVQPVIDSRMRGAGIELEWPPQTRAYQIVLAVERDPAGPLMKAARSPYPEAQL